MIIITLDCDGTVWTGCPAGIITEDMIRAWLHKGYLVIMISDSPCCKDFAKTGAGYMPTPWGMRHETISRIMAQHQDAVIYYIDDVPDHVEACQKSIDPKRCIFLSPQSAYKI